jgi:hypothetical protein
MGEYELQAPAGLFAGKQEVPVTASNLTRLPFE